jgi:paraquat-inducible protein B
MSRRASPRAIGAFVLGAVALLVVAVAIFGGGRLFTPKETFVMFFEDDVAGLQVGAPVTFRGVRVGSVTGVRIRYDTDNLNITIPVYVQLDRRQVVVAGSRGWEEIEQMIQRGLRAELKMQSFVTGQVAVDLDFAPNTPIRLVGAVNNYPEIPTIRSSISQLRATFSDLVEEIRKLPLDQLIREVTATSQNMATLLSHVDTLVIDVTGHVNSSFEQVPGLVQDMRQMVADMNGAARDISRLTRDLDKNVPQISQQTLQAVGRLNKTLEQAQMSLTSVQNTLGDNSPLQYQMSQALTEITAAASSMRVLAEYLQQNPGVLLSGKGAQ